MMSATEFSSLQAQFRDNRAQRVLEEAESVQKRQSARIADSVASRLSDGLSVVWGR